MGAFGFWEILIIVAVLVVLFGAKRMPEIARSIGKGIHEFKNAKKELSEPLVNDDVDQENKDKEEKTVGKGKSERTS